MTEIEVNAPRGARRDDEDGAAVGVGLAKWLCLAATPTFAIMALVAGLDRRWTGSARLGPGRR